MINYASDLTCADKLVKLIDENRVFAVQADAGSVSDILTMADPTVQHYGRPDPLIPIPNAGISPMKDLKTASEDNFDPIVKLNTKGP